MVVSRVDENPRQRRAADQTGEGQRLFQERACLGGPAHTDSDQCCPAERFSLGAGVAAVVPGLGPADELTAAADAALYEAKRGGRNRAVASADTPADARRREPSRWSDSQA